ncbi:MAG: anti-sigma factor [Saprospiraceae bacterium]
MERQFNIQEYIDSGILEQFSLGLTSPEENVEILSILQQHPELKSELSAIDNALESYASQYSMPLSNDFKNKILESISKPPSIPNQPSSNFFQKLLTFTVFIGLAGTCFYFWKTQNDQKTILENKSNELEKLRKAYEQDSLALLDCSSQISYFRNKNLNRVILKGTPHSPQSIAMVYYDTISHRTLLDVVDLPSVSKEQQYQLWAIVAGKPVDLGVFDLDDKKALKEIKFVGAVQAFAITLEPKGGLASPTMDQMYVMGGI